VGNIGKDLSRGRCIVESSVHGVFCFESTLCFSSPFYNVDLGL